MGIVRNLVNTQLLELSYREPRNLKNFLKNWGGLESLSLKGDTVATCILADLKRVTGIDPEKYDRNYKLKSTLPMRNEKTLSEFQFICIFFVLVLGYNQHDVAYMMNCSQQAINIAINHGIKNIQIELRAFEGED